MVERFDPPRDLDWKPLPMRQYIAGQYVRYSALAAARAEIERLTFALAEVEALELQHGAVIARLAEENRRLREAILREAAAICKRIRLRPDLSEDERVGVLECALALTDEANAARAALSSTGEKG